MMGILELFLIAVGLSMDAFAVSVCAGLGAEKAVVGHRSMVVGLYFGGFQALMPLIGYLIGASVAGHVIAFSNWIAFLLLAVIGGKMIKDCFQEDDGEEMRGMSTSPATMLPLALATSIDALAVGLSFALLGVRIIPAVLFIGTVTLLLSVSGVRIGNVFGLKYRAKAEFAGGAILLVIGVKTLITSLL